MSEKNIKLIIEYAGSGYSGWQSQDGPHTIQDELTAAVKKITGQDVNLVGAGRTDAGVHALGQVANFRIDHELPATRFADALNYYLPDDIRIRNSEQVDMEFHARFDARFRRYRYLIAKERSAIYRRLRWELPSELSLDKLKAAAEFTKGEHDFAPFCVVASRKESNICRIERAEWRRIGPLHAFEIRADRFLHSMVRSLVGAMVNLATAKPDDNPQNLTLDAFVDIIESPGGQRVPFTAPAHGLYLVSVGY